MNDILHNPFNSRVNNGISIVGSVDGSKVWKASEDRRCYASEKVETDTNGWGPCQLHPGTHVIRFGCFLPDLTW